MRNILLILLAFTLFACKDKDNDNPIVGEWEVINIVRDGTDIPIDECNVKSRVVITDNHFTYYQYVKNKDNCNSVIEDYDYTIEGNAIRQKGEKENNFHYRFGLENNNAQLRIIAVSGNYSTYSVFKRK